MIIADLLPLFMVLVPFFSFALLALLDRPLDIVPNPRPRRLVYQELVQRRDLLPTTRADEVALEQVRLNTLLAIRRATARCLDSIAEELVVDGARQRLVAGRALADFGFREPFGSLYLLLPGCPDGRLVSTKARTKGRHLQVRLRNDVAALWGDHDALAERRAIRVLDSFQEAARDTRRSLDAWPVIVVSVVIRGTVLDPVSYNIR